MILTRVTRCLLSLAVVTGCCGIAAAVDWPQILGPNLDGVAHDEKIADAFPKSGPKVAWKRSVGEGFAGVAAADGNVVLFHRVDGQEVVELLDAKTGKPQWATKHPTTFTTAFSSDNGPRCVPIIHKDHVYVYGAQGVLRCLQLKDGTPVWTRKTQAEYGAPEGYFGAGSTPIVVGDKILVNVGSRRGAGIVAFNLKTGKEVWKATNEYASYSSPIAVTIDGVQHVIFITRLKCLSLDPDNGKVRWEFPFGKRGPTVNASSPIVNGGYLFVSAHYGVGATYAKIGKTKADILWSSDEIMSNHYMTCLPQAGHLIGIHGQERVNEPELRCIDPMTKKIVWKKSGFPYGAMIKADGKLIHVSTSGELILLKADAKKYDELARAQVLAGTTRALPALSNGYLYVRDTTTLKCLDLRKPAK